MRLNKISNIEKKINYNAISLVEYYFFFSYTLLSKNKLARRNFTQEAAKIRQIYSKSIMKNSSQSKSKFKSKVQIIPIQKF